MITFDTIYKEIVNRIISDGVDQRPGNVRTHYVDGTPAVARMLEGVSFAITPEMGVPRLQSKFVGGKWACTEIEWIFQAMSNNIDWLHDNGNITIWDEWSNPPNYYTDGRPVIPVKPRVVTEDFGEPTLDRKVDEWTDENKTLHNVWKNMISRCYDVTHPHYGSYGGKGVQVHPEWWSFKTFCEDAKQLPHYCFKLKDPKNFKLDKDYYSSNCYSKYACLWLPQEENTWYTSSAKAILVTDPEGNQTEYVSLGQAIQHIGVCRATLAKLLKESNGAPLKGLTHPNTARYNGWQFQELTSEYPLRLSLLHNTIGKAYGWQLRNKKRKGLNQVEYMLDQLKHNSHSRRIVTTLWAVEDLDYMALEPCVWATHWTVVNGKLNLHVKQRSADIALGLPYNVLQYHALHQLVADHTGFELGTMYWNIDNAHIYDRHVKTLIEQVNTPMSQEVMQARCKLILPEGENFFHRRLSQVQFVDYKHMGKYSYEVAI